MNPGPAANSIQDAFSTVKSSGKNGITIGHTNVRGLYTNLAQVKLLAFNTNLNVLAISETHLSPALKDHEIAIQGYQILRRDRIGRTGGGVVIYYKDSLDCISIEKLNYLNDRCQCTLVNGYISDLTLVQYGIPQGSLLGPRLYTIYVNDLPDAITLGNVLMYADDTTIYCIGNSFDEVCLKLNKVFDELRLWSLRSTLSIHPIKTEAMIVTKQGLMLSNIMFLTTLHLYLL